MYAHAMHHLLAHISLLMMQVAKLLEERYCQPPPPGCPIEGSVCHHGGLLVRGGDGMGGGVKELF